MRNKINLTITALILAVAVLGCSQMTGGKKAAEAAVEKFHQQLNAREFSQIYADSSDALKEVTTEKDLIAVFETIGRRLGTFQSGSNTSFNISTDDGGARITLTYDSEFTLGKGTEKFIFEIKGDKAVLNTYNINSEQLK